MFLEALVEGLHSTLWKNVSANAEKNVNLLGVYSHNLDFKLRKKSDFYKKYRARRLRQNFRKKEFSELSQNFDFNFWTQKKPNI